MIDKNQGICTTCNYGSTCVQCQYHGQPVWYCEEFDDYTPSLVKVSISNSILMSDRMLTRPGVDEKLAEYSGLCVNCENREICAFSKLGSEIWQCNEYV